jgi:hypothetical protein
MDFNDIQNAWNNDTNDEVKLPTHLEKIKTANTPLDKIKKSMRKEFIYQTIAILFAGFAPIVYKFPESTIKPYYLLFTLFLAVSIYYLVKFYLFYKRLSKTTFNTKDNLYETYFELKLHIEMYKSFSFSLIPFLILFLLGFIFHLAPDIINEGMESKKFLIPAFIIITFSVLFMGVVTEWWVNYFYGKDIKEIRKVINELKEE